MSFKVRIENLWETEQRDELFVCMSFHDSLNHKFDIIDKAARDAGFSGGAMRVDRYVEGEVIVDRIIAGILNSRMVLLDLSDDPEILCGYANQRNENVLFELGIACSIREKEDLILIKNKKSKGKLPFNIKDLRYKEHDEELTSEWLMEILKTAIENQKRHNKKRLELTKQSLTPNELLIMDIFGRLPTEHYNDNFMLTQPGDLHIPVTDVFLEGESGSSLVIKEQSIYRLLDIGVLRLNLDDPGKVFSYWWTSFGYELMKYIKREKYSEEEIRSIFTKKFLNLQYKQIKGDQNG